MDRNQIEGIAGMDFSEFKKVTVKDVEKQIKAFAEFTMLNKTTYCKEIRVIGKRRYILCFNPQLFKDQKKAREEQIAKFKSSVKDLNEELLEAKNNRGEQSTRKKFEACVRKAKLQSFINIELVEKCTKLKGVRTYQCTFSADEEKKLETGKLDGFWLLVTNHSEKNGANFIQDTNTVVQPYREKVIIESSFRDIKSFIEISPVHVWREEHVKAHYTICVLAYLIDRTLTLSLHATKGERSNAIVTHERLYEELGECRLNHIRIADTSHQTHMLTEVTEKQRDVLQRLQMTHLTNETAVRNLNTKASID